MTARSYRFAFTGSIEVDDTTVKSAMLAFRVSDGIGGPPIQDDDANFDLQQQMLAEVANLSPLELMRGLLVNGLYMRLPGALQKQLPGAEVRMTGFDVDLVDGDAAAS